MTVKIGTTALNMKAMNELSTPVPEPSTTWRDYATQSSTAAGGAVGKGSPVAEWVFALLDDLAMRTALKSYCSGASADVYIQTYDGSGVAHTYACTLIWPPAEEMSNNWLVNLTLTFRNLVQVA